MIRELGRAAAAVPVLLPAALLAGAGAQERATELYACGGEPRAEAAAVGVTLCDGEPTPELLAQAEADNLQVRDGALVTAVAEDGFVHHHLSASFDNMDGSEKKALFERNREIFEGKWGPWEAHRYRRSRPEKRL